MLERPRKYKYRHYQKEKQKGRPKHSWKTNMQHAMTTRGLIQEDCVDWSMETRMRDAAVSVPTKLANCCLKLSISSI